MKIKEATREREREGKRGREIERERERERKLEGNRNGGEKVKKERDGDHWSDFTLGLFSDGRRYETPSRACSNSGIPIPWLVEIVTFHPGRIFSKKWLKWNRPKNVKHTSINYHVCFGHITANNKTNFVEKCCCSENIVIKPCDIITFV